MATTVNAPTSGKGHSLLKRPAVVRLLLIALLAETGYAVMNLSTMQPYLRDDRQFGPGTIGLVIVAFLLSEAIFKSPMGHLSDRIGPKRLMLIGPSLSVFTAFGSLLVPRTGGSFPELLAFLGLRSIDGLGAAMLWPAAFTAVSDAVADGERQEAMSFLNLCYMVGIAIAFGVGGVANDLTHAKYAGMIMAGLMFLGVAVAVWRLVPEIKTGQSTGQKESEGSLSGLKASLKHIPTYLLLSLVTFAGIGFPLAIFKLFPSDQFHMSESMIGALVLPCALGMGAASVPMSRLGERIGRANAVHLGLGLAAAGMWLIAVGAFIPPFRQAWIFALCGIPLGIGFLLAIPAWMASVSDINPQCRGANLGAVMTAQGIGAIVSAPIGSFLYEKMQPVGMSLGLGQSFGRYSPFVGCATCLTIGFILSLRILRDSR
jgi:DHA1 family multidrug resistance protein-like MFS transporter